jgi:hypothetical protein
MRTPLLAAAAAVCALALAGCGSTTTTTVIERQTVTAPAASPAASPAGPVLKWACSVTSGGGDGTWSFTATVTASNPGTAPVAVGQYTVIIFNAAGAEIFSDTGVMNGTVLPGQQLSASDERGSVLTQAPASCQVPSWTSELAAEYDT